MSQQCAKNVWQGKWVWMGHKGGRDEDGGGSGRVRVHPTSPATTHPHPLLHTFQTNSSSCFDTLANFHSHICSWRMFGSNLAHARPLSGLSRLNRCSLHNAPPCCQWCKSAKLDQAAGIIPSEYRADGKAVRSKTERLWKEFGNSNGLH